MKSREQPDLFPGALEMMILRKQTSSDLLEIEEASLDPALPRLLEEELREGLAGDFSTNRRFRIYQTTARGTKHLDREVTRFERMLGGITRVLARGAS